MSDLLEKTKKLFLDVNKINKKGIKEYLIISNFGNSSIGSEPGFIYPYFRIFTPVKSYKGRKLNSVYGDFFNPFKDTLMDYPTIVQYKLGKPRTSNWENYNRLTSLHIARCPLDCWHCYLEECLRSNCKICTKEDCDKNRKANMGIREGWFSAKKIVDSFIEQRNRDKEAGIFSTNILRVTGGEPFLVPELLVEILGELKSRQLHKEVFLWTETNLIPLTVQENNGKLVPDKVLYKLAKYDNFCVHPCFHGLNQNNFNEITGQTIDNIDFLLNAFKRLLNAGIDIYPTFGSNMSSPKDVECFYNKISEINELLPLRFCLIEYDLDYNPIKWRRNTISNFSEVHKKVYDKFQVIEKWDELLKENTKYKYSEKPRHLVPIKKEVRIMNLKNKKIVHLFHWPSTLEYQESFLKMIALPTGARGKLKYDEKYVNKTFIDEIKNINESKKFEAIFWVLSCKPKEDKNKKVINIFDFACPVRLVKNLNVEKKDNNYYINFIMKDFISKFSKIDNKDNLKKYMEIELGSAKKPYPGMKGGFAYIGPNIEKIKTTQTPSLEELYEVLENIPCSLGFEDGITIKEYPLVKIKEIKSRELNKNGLYELNINQEYQITLSYYQGENYRNRRIHINDNRFYGRSGTKNISIEEKKKNKDKISKIVVKFGYFEFIVQLPVIVKVPLHKHKFFPLLILIVLSAISFCIYLEVYPESTNEVKAAASVPIIVLLLAKIVEVLSK